MQAAATVGVAAILEKGGYAEFLIRHGITHDRSGNLYLARRAFLAALYELDKLDVDIDDPVAESIREHLQDIRETYPSLDVALDYHLRLVSPPAGRWVILHEQQPTDDVAFLRQEHAGSAFDSRRGRLIVFGSDTHGKNWQNSPAFFEPRYGEWSRAYPDDAPDTYAIDASGVPIAGSYQDHPWAMHTYGAICYDTARDELIVGSHPAHLQPSRFTDALSHVWDDVRTHPTWILHLEDNTWSTLAAPAISFFPYAIVCDSIRSTVIGFNEVGVFELSGSPRDWTLVNQTEQAEWHNNAVYDSKNGVMVSFGDHENSNDVIVYEPSSGRLKTMPTEGERPEKTESLPLAFHAGIGMVVALTAGKLEDVAPPSHTETWLYDIRIDRWQHVESARLPIVIEMNYNMEYDSVNNLILLVASSQSGATTVWMLRLE